jgi:uncharacterized protein YqhQ
MKGLVVAFLLLFLIMGGFWVIGRIITDLLTFLFNKDKIESFLNKFAKLFVLFMIIYGIYYSLK